MNDDPNTPRFFSKQKSEIDDILSDIDDDLSDDVLDVESFNDAPLKASKFSGFKSRKSSGEFIGGKPRSSAPLLIGTLAVLLAGGAGAYFYLSGDMGGAPKIAAPLAPLAPAMTPPDVSPDMTQDMVGGLPQPPADSIDAPTPALPSTLPDVAGDVGAVAPVPAPALPQNTDAAALPTVPGQVAVQPTPAPAPTEPAATPPNPTVAATATPPVNDPSIAPPPSSSLPAPVASPSVAPLPNSPPIAQPEDIKTDTVQKAETVKQDSVSVPSQEAMKGEDKTDKATKSAQKTGKIKYFDAPRGEILDDIAPPSIDVSRNPGESIIIVQKPAGFSSSESYRAGGDDNVRIERSGSTDIAAQNNVAADRALRLGRYDMAREFYNDILAQNPNDVSALLGRAIADQKLGNLDAAMNGYRDVLRRDQSNVTAATNLAGLQSLRSPEAALNNLEKVYNANPDDPAVKGQMGVSLAESGNTESAYDAFLKATQTEPKNPQHFYNLAVTADRLGKRAEAIAAYEKCLEVDAIYGTGRGINRDVIYDRLTKLRAQ